MINILYQVIGIVGSAFIVFAFYFIQKNKNRMMFYNVINLIGAILLSISLIKQPNIGSIAIEVFWIIISIYGIVKNK